ncbi:hypothetical protein [Pseudomonas sp. NFX224]|uniref:hypothetical protein n=1 Tax=Pseudomonas sp. NFX224 TaxID=3402862 RepID=UPI003AFAE763
MKLCRINTEAISKALAACSSLNAQNRTNEITASIEAMVTFGFKPFNMPDCARIVFPFCYCLRVLESIPQDVYRLISTDVSALFICGLIPVYLGFGSIAKMIET